MSILFSICKFYKCLLKIADLLPSQGNNIVFFLHSKGSNTKQTFEFGRKSNLTKMSVCLNYL